MPLRTRNLSIAMGVLLGAQVQSAELMLFGGAGHDVFLGCLTCSEYDSNSVCNGYGSYGNEYGTSGVWNEYSGFGNEYSPESPWNEYSSSKSVPVVVDRDGKFYGYFTINEFRTDSVAFSAEMKQWFDRSDGDLEQVRIKLCEFFGKSG